MGLFQRISSYFSGNKPTAGIVEDGERFWWAPSTWVSHTQAGEVVSEMSLMSSATCFACTKALSETTAGLPTSIYRAMQDAKKEVIGDNQAMRLLCDEPNPHMDAFTFYELMVTRIHNSGNFFAEIQRDSADRPIALWPIHPTRVTALWDEDGEILWQIANDFQGDAQYSDPTWRKQHLRFLSSHNMLNVVGFGSNNGIISRGVLPGAQEIGIDFATRKFGAEFFAKGAMPAGMILHPKQPYPTEQQRANFRADANRIHNNKSGGHQIGVLWDGATYEAISVAPEQAQFLETRKYTSHQICKLYGVPPAIIGDYQDSKFATADAMIRHFVMLTLKSVVSRIESALNRQVLKVRGSNGILTRAFEKPYIFKFTLDGLLRGDPEMQSKVWKMLRETGAASTNDILRGYDMNPIEGPEGDYRVLPGGYVRLDQIDNQGTRVQQAQAQPEQSASLPRFDREEFAKLIESSGLIEPTPQARGVDLALNAVVYMAEDALNRIHSIVATQVERWREKDPSEVAEKLPEFWNKQRSRLVDALQPVDKLAANIKEASLSEKISSEYFDCYSKLDNYQIFDAECTKLKIDVEAIVERELCY